VNLPVVWEAITFFLILSNTNVKLALLPCKEKEMSAIKYNMFEDNILEGQEIWQKTDIRTSVNCKWRKIHRTASLLWTDIK
jgi:hypothetical protein